MAELHVVFGAGSLGTAVAERLVARGHRARVVSRSGKGEVPAGAESARGDATVPSSVKEVCAGAAAVYCCAVPAYTDWPASLPPLQNGLIEGVGAVGARLVTAENVYVYGRTSGAPMTEDTPWNPCSKKGELRARLNRELLDAHKEGRVKAALGRGPDYYGPRADLTTIYGGQVFGRAVLGKAANIFGDIDARHTQIYVEDFAAGLVTLGENESAMGQAWHLPCAPTITQRALLELIYAAAGHKMKAQALPGFMVKLIGVFSPLFRELAEMNYQWESDYDFRHDKFDRTFPGAVAVHSHDVAVKKTVEWFRAHKPA